jgi:uncharacterized protein YicC (UPF0701 family)
VQYKAEKDAIRAIQKADPAIQAIFSQMMAAIGANNGEGIRGTVRDTWLQPLVAISNDFANSQGNNSGKRQAVLRYVDTMDKRDNQDRALASLRLSISLLAQAHGELAQGRQRNAAALIELLQGEYKAYRDRISELEKQAQSTAKAGEP